MRIAIVGCGYVADQYMLTLPRHRGLELAVACDRDRERARRFGDHYGVPVADSLDQLLAVGAVEMVLNLTNPRSHHEVTWSCLEAGKHVYSEKPLAMSIADARELAELANARGLRLSGAPSRILGEPAQTMWKALRDGRVGTPRLAYAEMDDGMIHRMDYGAWRGASGAPWPFRDEFEMGCVVEHAGYALTWLLAFFGPAVSVTAFCDTLVRRQDIPGVDPSAMGPDFAVAGIRHSSGVVSRLTCSNLAPEDHSIRVFGDTGVLATANCWMPHPALTVEDRVVKGKWAYAPKRTAVPQLRDPGSLPEARSMKKVDFCLGPLELAAAIREGRESRLSARFCVHATEVMLAINAATSAGHTMPVTSTFEPMAPMPWAT